jgi:hypothetical protein
MTLCPFKNLSGIFGEPGKGFHKIRLLDVALGDYIGTIFLAILLSYLTSIPLVLATIFMYTLSVILHMLFGVSTSAVKYLGLTC